MSNEAMYDVVIIGAGPGGLNAALYASRSGLRTLIVEKEVPGGKINSTSEVENWLGFKKISGLSFQIPYILTLWLLVPSLKALK